MHAPTHRRGKSAELVGLGEEPPGGAVGRRVALAVPPVLVLLGTLFEIISPPGVVFAALFAAAPLVAAPLYSALGTALVGAVGSLLLVVMLHVEAGETVMEGGLKSVTVATVSVLAVGLNRVVRRSARRLASQRDIAEAVQRALMPDPEERLGPLDIAARYQAAHADASIGGDMYAVQRTPFGVRLLVGDVRGKGLEAVGSVAVVLGAFREAAEEEPELARVAHRLDRALHREYARRTGGVDRWEDFTTAVLAEVTDAGRLRVVNCGHPAPWLVLPDGALAPVEPPEPALPLGLAGLPLDGGEPPPVRESRFTDGATLLMNTDGLTETRDPGGVFYDPADRSRLGTSARHGPGALLDAILADVAAYRGGPPADDMALLAVTYRDRAVRGG